MTVCSVLGCATCEFDPALTGAVAGEPPCRGALRSQRRTPPCENFTGWAFISVPVWPRPRLARSSSSVADARARGRAPARVGGWRRGACAQKRAGTTRGGCVRWPPTSPTWIEARGGGWGQTQTATAGWPPRGPIFLRRRHDAPMGVAAFFSGRPPWRRTVPDRDPHRWRNGSANYGSAPVEGSTDTADLREACCPSAPPRSVPVARALPGLPWRQWPWPAACAGSCVGGRRRGLIRCGGGAAARGARPAATAAAVSLGPVGVAAVPPMPRRGRATVPPRATEAGDGGWAWPASRGGRRPPSGQPPLTLPPPRRCGHRERATSRRRHDWPSPAATPPPLPLPLQRGCCFLRGFPPLLAPAPPRRRRGRHRRRCRGLHHRHHRRRCRGCRCRCRRRCRC